MRWQFTSSHDGTDRAAVNTGYCNDAHNTCGNDRASVNDINNAGTAANSCSNTHADTHADRIPDANAYRNPNAHANTNADAFTNPDACSVYPYVIVVCLWCGNTQSVQLLYREQIAGT